MPMPIILTCTYRSGGSATVSVAVFGVPPNTSFVSFVRFGSSRQACLPGVAQRSRVATATPFPPEAISKIKPNHT